jgi:hypothetical protein
VGCCWALGVGETGGELRIDCGRVMRSVLRRLDDMIGEYGNMAFAVDRFL